MLSANEAYAQAYSASELTGWAAKGLAVITCMDSRIDPLDILGMAPGDVKILRNAGARVTEDVLRTLVLATYLLGVRPRARHAAHRLQDGQRRGGRRPSADHGEAGVDTRSLEIRTVTDQQAALVTDIARSAPSRCCPPTSWWPVPCWTSARAGCSPWTSDPGRSRRESRHGGSIGGRMEGHQEVVTMPSGWMPDSRHDTRMRTAWAAIDRREQARRGAREHRRQRTMHRTVRHPLRPTGEAHA